MSWKNEQKCPQLRREGVNLNQSGYAAGGQGCPLPVEQRNKIKKICLKCKRKGCVYDKRSEGADDGITISKVFSHIKAKVSGGG